MNRPGATVERRVYPRVNLDTEVWLGQDGVFTQTRERLTNLSLGGAFIQCPDHYAAGSILSLRFRLGLDFVATTVIVRNARQGLGIGVEFLDLSDEHADRLRAFTTP